MKENKNLQSLKPYAEGKNHFGTVMNWSNYPQYWPKKTLVWLISHTYHNNKWPGFTNPFKTSVPSHGFLFTNKPFTFSFLARNAFCYRKIEKLPRPCSLRHLWRRRLQRNSSFFLKEINCRVQQ